MAQNDISLSIITDSLRAEVLVGDDAVFYNFISEDSIDTGRVPLVSANALQTLATELKQIISDVQGPEPKLDTIEFKLLIGSDNAIESISRHTLRNVIDAFTPLASELYSLEFFYNI